MMMNASMRPNQAQNQNFTDSYLARDLFLSWMMSVPEGKSTVVEAVKLLARSRERQDDFWQALPRGVAEEFQRLLEQVRENARSSNRRKRHVELLN